MTTLIVACGGGAKEAKEPESGPETAARPAATDRSDAPKEASTEEGDGDKHSDRSGEKAGKADKAGKASSSSAAPASEEKKKSMRSAKDIITRPDVLYMFAFAASEPHQVADKKCSEKSGDDPKKKADCMSNASKSFQSDDMAFIRGDEGNFRWVTVRHVGKGLVPIHKVDIDFEADSDTSVTIKPHGPDTGTKPGGLPRSVVIEVIGESQIAVTDPKQGRLVYESRLGGMGKSER